MNSIGETSVCIILIALVYPKSAKVYTGPKIVRVLNRLRNTGLTIVECKCAVSNKKSFR